jgi:hypothetical protein
LGPCWSGTCTSLDQSPARWNYDLPYRSISWVFQYDPFLSVTGDLQEAVSSSNRKGLFSKMIKYYLFLCLAGMNDL